jgi:hypothetical protein
MKKARRIGLQRRNLIVHGSITTWFVTETNSARRAPEAEQPTLEELNLNLAAASQCWDFGITF